MVNTYTFDIKLEVFLRNALIKQYPRLGMDKIMAAVADGAKATIDSITRRFVSYHAHCQQAEYTKGVRQLDLFDLPPEVREMIYELAFTTTTVDPLATGTSKGPTPMHQPGITRTNRQLRAEALPHFYTLTQFDIEITASTKKLKKSLDQVAVAQKWLMAIGQRNRKAIQRLRIAFDSSFLWLGLTRVEDVMAMEGFRDVAGAAAVWERREAGGRWRKWAGGSGPRRIVFED